MGMMDSMMQGMIKALPVEDRKALMLKMMPDMMKQVDMAKMMPNMLKQLAGLISLLSVYGFLQILFQDDEAKALVKDAFGDLTDKMPAMMEMMHPMMESMMTTVMPKMMGFMATMMPNMREIMPRVMDEKMIPMIKENPEMKDHMLEMMQTMFPHCATNMFPLIEKDERIAFIKKLYAIMAQSAVIEMDTDAKQSFHLESSGAVKDALCTNV